MTLQPRTATRVALARKALETGMPELVLNLRHYEVLRRRANGETLKSIGSDPDFPGYPPYSPERIRQLESEALRLVELRQPAWWWRDRDTRYLVFVLRVLRKELA